MPEYLAPGVFVEEIDTGSKPIEGVGINTAAFIGYAKSGEFNTPTFISNWSQFCQLFGEEENSLTRALCDELQMSAIEVREAKQTSRKGWMEFAQQAIGGAARNGNGSGKSWQQFLHDHKIPQGGLPYLEDCYLAHSVRGYYDNGGSRAYIIRVARREDLETLRYQPKLALTDGADGGRAAQVIAGPLVVKALQPGRAGNNIKVEVEHAGDGDEFRVKISQGRTTERFPEGPDVRALTLETIQSAINDKSQLIQVEVSASRTATATATRPEAKVFTLEGGVDAVPVSTRAAGAPAPPKGLAALEAGEFIGDENQRTGMGALAALEDVNYICIPDLMAGAYKRIQAPGANGNGTVGPEELALLEPGHQAILDIQCALVAYCERMGDRQAILDSLPGLTPQQMLETTRKTSYSSDHGQGAIYYPWIKVVDPLHRGQQMFVPPSGHVAGVWARVGVERGVHKAPANESMLGAVALEWDVSKGEQEILNPDGINCIRAFPGRGIRIWGARTLATVGNPSWKYVNVRRLFNYLEKSMERGLQWVVFEPNDHDLWGRVRRNLAAFLWTEWKEGKLFGTVPGEAFYVKCDAETNPQEMIDLGRLYVEIGVNPVKPAEFVIIRIGQWSASSSIAEQ